MENQIISINLVPNMSTPAVVQVSQYDIGRPLVFKVYDGTSPADLTGVTAVVEGTKKSGLGFSESGTISDNTVTLVTTLAMTQEDGSIPAEIRFSKTGEDVGTANFILAVEKTPHAEGTTDGTQETMADLQTQLNGLDTRVTALEAGGGGSGLTDDVKIALLQIAQKVAYIDEHGQTYYNALYNALYPPADLVSISAVYTQSGTVYDTDTLESLKADLVVTATYDDSTTAVVTNYTLSGTLTVGTSTITVSYGGKTTTFTVTVTQEPPYTFYDYIQGDGTAYINTGLLASTYCTNDYEQEVKVAGHTTESTKTVCGARQQWGSANARSVWHTNATYSQNYCGIDTGYVMSGSSLDVPVVIKTTIDKKIYCDDVLIDTATGAVSITHTGPITLFAECTSGQGSGYVAIDGTNAYAGAFSKVRIYYFKVWDSSDNLISEIKPALRKSDNAIGMYDTVRDMFFENARDQGALSLGNE